MDFNIIVFSKDRAMQLELFLRSFAIYVYNFHRYKINVLYTYSNKSYKEGYDKLIKEIGVNIPYFYQAAYCMSIKFILENDFRKNVIELVNPNKKYTVFFVDDDIFKNQVDFYDRQMDIFNNDPKILCRSLRLHPNLTYCYTQKTKMRKPEFLADNVFYWKKTDIDYGYPMSVDGHIFRTKEIFPLIKKIDFINPNTFEGYMAVNPLTLPKMICYDTSIIVNNPVNMVQTNNENYHGNISQAYLNKMFLKGYKISLENIAGIENISCHQEIEFKLFKDEV